MTTIVHIRAETHPDCTGLVETPAVFMGVAEIPSVFTAVSETLRDCNIMAVTLSLAQKKRVILMTKSGKGPLGS